MNKSPRRQQSNKTKKYLEVQIIFQINIEEANKFVTAKNN